MKYTIVIRSLKLDLKRAFLSWEFIVSIVLGVSVCYFTLFFCGNYKSETIHKFIMLHDWSQSFLAYIVGILPYALCLYEDLAYGNLRNVMGRISITNYVFSKTVVAILATVCAFVLGKIIFAALYSIDNPICLPDTLSRIPSDILYIGLIEKQNYWGFFLMTSLHKALYCGILCQLVMLISILVPNKAVAFSIPVAVFYIFNFYLNNKINSELFNFSRIFDGITCIWKTDWMCFGYSVTVAMFSYFVLYALTLRIMRKKVYDE